MVIWWSEAASKLCTYATEHAGAHKGVLCGFGLLITCSVFEDFYLHVVPIPYDEEVCGWDK